MSTPNLSLGGLDHYTPELRDRILEKLSAAHLSETAYQMLTPARLRSLIEIEAADATVVSFYMQLSPGGSAVLGARSFRVSARRP